MATMTAARSAEPQAQRPARRIVAMLDSPVSRRGCLRGVPVELDARGIALVGVARGGVELDGELVAVLLVGGVRAERGHEVTGGAHLGDRAGAVLADVVAVAAGRRGRADEGAAVDDREVELAGQRVGAVGV